MELAAARAMAIQYAGDLPAYLVADLAAEATALVHHSRYRPTTISTPAAMARMAITISSPEKRRLSSGISPVRISQTASSSIPMFLVSLIGPLPWLPVGHPSTVRRQAPL